MGNNAVLGAGRCFLKRAGESIERYLGDTLSASLSLASERQTTPAGDGPDINRKLIDIVTSTTHTVSIVMRDLSLDNWALFVQGTVSVKSVAAVADEEHSLGADVRTAVTGAVAVLKAAIDDLNSRAAVKTLLAESSFGGGTALTRAGTDDGVGTRSGQFAVAAAGFTVEDADGDAIAAATIVDVDAAATTIAEIKAARILYVPSLAIVAVIDPVVVTGTGGDADQKHGKFQISYTPDAASQVSTLDTETIKGSIRYVEDPLVGKGRNLYVASATVGPNGEVALKDRQTAQQLPISCIAEGEVLIDGAAV